jgi:anti-sigma B factor antagonist
MTAPGIRRDGDKAVVSPGGDILASTAPGLRAALRDLIGAGARELVVDLDGTSMVDSTGLGLLLAAFNSVRAAGGTFAVIHASDELLELFRAMRLHQHFRVSGREPVAANREASNDD